MIDEARAYLLNTCNIGARNESHQRGSLKVICKKGIIVIEGELSGSSQGPSYSSVLYARTCVTSLQASRDFLYNTKLSKIWSGWSGYTMAMHTSPLARAATLRH